MRFRFIGTEAVLPAVRLVAHELGITLVSENEDIAVTVTEVSESSVSVKLDGKTACIAYGGGTARFLRGLATLNGWLKAGKTSETVTERTHFKVNGGMLDMSRNAVMTVDTVKFMLRKSALMGLNMLMLYTEDTYEIEGRPYFGHMRGRYSKAELRELDRYALTLGIELIPCIQVLGHLATHLRWKCAVPYLDMNNVMLVGADATYELIGDMLDTVSECFTSRRVHIGMDETYEVGRGKSLDIFGYRKPSDVYLEHLSRVADMARERGLSPLMWSDMLFRLAGEKLENYTDYDIRINIPEDYRERVPQDITQVFWNYDHADTEFFDVGIKNHRLFTDRVMVAGGLWTESGHSIVADRSRNNAAAILTAAVENGIDEVLATSWGDGYTGNLILTIMGLSWYADTDYRGSFDEDGARVTFENATGMCYDDFFALGDVEKLDGTKFATSLVLLHNDPLIGLCDTHFIGMDAGEYYKKVSERLAASADAGYLEPMFKVIKALSSVLENKADFGIRLKAAYDENDRETLASLADECAVITEKLNALSGAHYKAWMTYNKPFGWEVLDLKYGGLVHRFECTKRRISEYLSGEISEIAELCEERLRFDCGNVNKPGIIPRFMYLRFDQTFTAGRI